MKMAIILNLILMLLNLVMAFLNYERKNYKVSMFCFFVAGGILFSIIYQIIKH